MPILEQEEGYLVKEVTRRILIVEDYEPFRQYLRGTLEQQPGFQLVGEAPDGIEAIRKAEELQPDLVLLDVGLPRLNGLEAARQIRQLAPQARILFLTQEFSFQMAEAALRLGALGYVHKLRAHSELPVALECAIRGKYFVTGICGNTDEPPATDGVRHEVHFCSDDAGFLESFTEFIAVALAAGKTAVMIADESHRNGVLTKLNEQHLDVGHTMSAGLLVSLDSMGLLSQLMIDDSPDPARFFDVAGGLIAAASRPRTNTQVPQVAVCGELPPVLLANGQIEGALRLEQLWGVLAHFSGFDLLCEYALSAVENRQDLYESICSEHSAVRSC